MYTQAPSELASSGRTRGCLDRKIRLLFGVWASAARKAGPRRAREAGLLWAAVTLEHAAGGGSRTRVAQGPGQSRGAEALLRREARGDARLSATLVTLVLASSKSNALFS